MWIENKKSRRKFLEIQEDTQPFTHLRKEGKDDKIKIQILQEIGATSTECFETSEKDAMVDLAIYTKGK